MSVNSDKNVRYQTKEGLISSPAKRKMTTTIQNNDLCIDLGN